MLAKGERIGAGAWLGRCRVIVVGGKNIAAGQIVGSLLITYKIGLDLVARVLVYKLTYPCEKIR